MRQRTNLRLRPVIKHTKARTRSRAGQASVWMGQLLPRGMGVNTIPDAAVKRTPIVIMAVIGMVILVVLTMQLLHLQLVEGERLRGMAEGNRIRERITYAPRGEITDRNGKVLASNTASYQLAATPYLLPEAGEERRVIYREIAATIDSLSVSDITNTIQEEGLGSPEQVVLEDGISHETALQLEYQLPEWKGMAVESIPVRDYESEAALAHILGYVGRVSSGDLDKNPDLNPNGFVGKHGIEKQYDGRLRGQDGVVETEVDALGRPLRTLRETDTRAGEDIALSIDYQLQMQFTQSLRKYINERDVESGAGVIMHPETGEVLAMASVPSFDNNAFQTGISSERYRQLLEDPKQPMLNRAISGAYPTGSTIKPITLMGALETGVVNENTIIHDRGAITVTSQYDPGASFTFEGWDPSGLGPMNARRAIAMSSNIYFYTVGGGHGNFEGMGVEALTRYYTMFGLGSDSGIDLPNASEGLIPTPEWKREQTGESWYVGDTYNLSIGQGDLQASPIQMARAYAALINGGRLVSPHLVSPEQEEQQIDVSQDNLQVAQEGMRQVVSGGGTTSPAVFADVGVDVAGKSGTAETAPDMRDPHAWYVAYAPYEDPELVSAVIVEEGEGGSDYAAPVIAEAFAAYFD